MHFDPRRSLFSAGTGIFRNHFRIADKPVAPSSSGRAQGPEHFLLGQAVAEGVRFARESAS